MLIKSGVNKKFHSGKFSSDFNAEIFDFSSAKFVLKNKRKSVFFSDAGKREDFLAGGKGKYFSQDILNLLRQGKNKHKERNIDSLETGVFKKSKIRKTFYTDRIFFAIKNRYQNFEDYIANYIRETFKEVSLTKAWNFSIVGSVIFGVLLMTMFYRYLGQKAFATSGNLVLGNSAPQKAIVYEIKKEAVLGANDNKNSEDEEKEVESLGISVNDENSYITKILEDSGKKEKDKKQSNKSEEKRKKDLENKIVGFVKGYPIEKMVPIIVEKDKMTAAFMVSIAKKESDWGKHVPVLDGKDCYNYWGFRAIRSRMGTGGHTCFDSPKDAVDSVAKRIDYLIQEEKLNTPEKMVVWKCGYDCSWDSKKAINKWISDVDLYLNKIESK